jgi:hypothetical protein
MIETGDARNHAALYRDDRRGYSDRPPHEAGSSKPPDEVLITLSHLQALRRYWVERVRDLPRIAILTLEKPARYSAITAFRLPGLTHHPRAQKRSHLLLERMLT